LSKFIFMLASFENSLDFAKKMDQNDPLRNYRDLFHIPKHNNQDCIYFTGNSLGLQPKKTKEYILEELEDWAKYGVEGHFEAKRNWFGYHHFLTEKMATIVGAKPIEVVAMNTLSVNLNLLMVSFYRPQGKRTKIMMEAAAFPSDHYAMQQQVRFHGLNPQDEIILLEPSEGAHSIDTEAILNEIEKHKDSLALVMLGGVNYYTGQFFDLEKITKKAHEVGALAGYDLAHAAGNVVLNLHDWNVDFACWCSYKYLNSGPGGVSGVFIHEKYANSPELPRFAGWWGNDEKTRFLMQREFVPQEGAAGWQMSNAQILPMAAHLASIELFDEAGIQNLRAKSEKLTGFLEFLLQDISEIQIITPSNPLERGCQLSLIAKKEAKPLFQFLKEKGVVADWREPDVIRVAPVPMYNTFEDVYRFVAIVKEFYTK
jgi:kynureninase